MRRLLSVDKKFLMGLVIGVIISLTFSVFAGSEMLGKKVDNTYPLIIDGKQVPKDTISIDGTSYLPVRAAADYFGYKVDFQDGKVIMNKLEPPAPSSYQGSYKITGTQDKYVSFYYQPLPPLDPVKLDIKKTALLTIDVEKKFADHNFPGVPGWDYFHNRLDNTVVPNIAKLQKYFRDNGGEVTFARIACYHQDGRDRALVESKPGFNDILIPIGSPEAEFVDAIKPLPDEIVVNKTTDGVVTGTNYAQLLRNMHIENVVVTGLVTDQCVANTVRALADDGFNVYVAEDGCVAATQELHDAELRAMNMIYCLVMSSDEIIDALNRFNNK